MSQVSQAEIVSIDQSEIARLDVLLLDSDGDFRLWPAEVFYTIPMLSLRAWANVRGRYGLPTAELIRWLREQIGERTALEIGAGCGDLGYLLGIPMTDSYQQVDDKTTVAYLKALNITPTRPSDMVEKEEAEQAVSRRKPKVVIGSWITERYIPGISKQGNMHGPREEFILARCETYILIGNEATHGEKRLLQVPHRTYKFPWLISRARDQSKNVIYVWGKQ